MKLPHGRAALGLFGLIAIGYIYFLSRSQVSTAVAAGNAGSEHIVQIDSNAVLTERGKEPPDMLVSGPGSFDGSYTSNTSYLSRDRRFTVGLWESGPGTLKTDGYPHDEYCLVIEGDLSITNHSSLQQEFHPGDTFVIPKFKRIAEVDYV